MTKFWLFPALALVLASCSTATIKRTYVATTTPEPRSIYIQPFAIQDASYIGEHGASTGEIPIRRAIAPLEFARALKHELGKIAPATVLNPGEKAVEGWLVEGEFKIVDGGSKIGRATPYGPLGAARSTLLAHVKVIDVATGDLLYAFDVSGGSGLTAFKGNTGAPGVGPSDAFDYKNAAQRVAQALSIDPMRYGERSAPGFW
jgi:hypothetical protein